MVPELERRALVKHLIVAAAAVTALSAVAIPADAASPDELAQIREQLETLLQRVDRLEQQNEALRAENERLKASDEKLEAQDDDLKAEARGLRKDVAQQAVDVGKVKGSDWAAKVAVTGDMRYRYEMISDDTLSNGVQTADRHRERMRARVSVTAKATDNITVGIGLATSDGDPRSSNLSFTDSFSRKSIDLDTAYFDWRFASWGNLVGGKMKQPFVKPGQSLFWDNDLNPEGLAVGFQSGLLFGTAYNFWVDEVSGPETTLTADTMLHGLQIGARLPVGVSTLMLAAHYYDLSAGQGRAPFYDGNPNGNSTDTIVVGTTTTSALRHDFRVINLSAELSTTLGQLPLQLWADVAQNQDPDDLDTAWSAGVVLGKASNRRTWELGASYHVIEKDALFGQLIDSDLGAGMTDSAGWVLRAGYAPLPNWAINSTYYLSKRNVDVPNSAGQSDVDYDRLQLDFNVKF
jgi:hypothetical protein